MPAGDVMTQPNAREPHGIEWLLDEVLARRGMTLTELAQRVGISIVNLSVLKNGHAKAIRFSTLTRLCEVLDCQPGDLLRLRRPSAERRDHRGDQWGDQ
jgi:putative transcriptional regulator